MQDFMKGSAAGADLLPTAERRPHREAGCDEEDSWLKRAVSLPSLPKGPRSFLWSRAEGSEVCGGGDAQLRKQVSLTHLASKCFEDHDAPAPKIDAGTRATSDSEKRSLYRRAKKMDLVAKEAAHVDKHRQLKQILREQRQGEKSLSCSRHLVGHLVSSKDGCWRRKLQDQAKTEQSIKRIEENLHGCSHARHELMEMQRKLALVCNPIPAATLCSDLKHAFSDTLRRNHSFDEP